MQKSILSVIEYEFSKHQPQNDHLIHQICLYQIEI